MMNIGEQLCLQWNDFKENITSAFAQLGEDREFADVTLACEDGQQIKAHTVILSSTEKVKQIEDVDQKPVLEMRTLALPNYDRVDADMDRLDEQIDSMIATTDKTDPKSGKLVACKVCGKEGARAHVAPHIESKHIAGVSHTCEICGKTAR